MKTYAIGIDIGGTRTKIGLVELATGEVQSMGITPTKTSDGAVFMGHLGDVIHRFKEQVATEQAMLIGVGIGVPGFVFSDGRVDSTYGFLSFMEDYPLGTYLQQQTELPCRLDNDARVVALGEATYGQGKGTSRVLVLTLGTGLGVGFTSGGKLDGSLPFEHMGGHMTVATDDFVCYCGKTGCLESLVSAAGIGRLATRFGWAQTFPNVPPTAEAVFAHRQLGNPTAVAVVQAYMGYLRTGIDNYINLYAPDLIVLAGGIANGLENDTGTLQTPAVLRPYKAYRTRIVTSALKEQAGILGGAALFN